MVHVMVDRFSLEVTNVLKATRKLLLSCALLYLTACSQVSTIPQLAAAAQQPAECVLLVHGLWRTGNAMNSIAEDLAEWGYHPVIISYPSTEHDIPTLANKWIAEGLQQCEKSGARKYHIVTHSMGGILVRHYLQQHTLPAGSRIVMLSPPNQGAELSEKFGKEEWFEWIAGPAAISLTKQPDGIIRKLAPIQGEIGIIAAQRAWSLWPESWLPKPNDGTIGVENMRLDEMRDFVLIENGHAMMRFDDNVQAQIRHFLHQGRFHHEPSAPDVAQQTLGTDQSHGRN